MTVSVVTGATGGIGRWISLGLAQAGHRVVLLGRDAARCAQAGDWITARVPGAAIEIETADLSLLTQVREAADRVTARHAAIGLLVNNAGVFCTRREETTEGHERVIAVNHLAPLVLTLGLLPALRAAGQARVVNVGSSTSDRARISPDDLEGRRRWGLVHSYAQSKLALMMATFHLAREWAGSGVVANVVHPGTVASGLVRASGPIGLVWRLMSPFMLTEEQGADTPLHVALSPDYATVSGTYVKQRRAVTPNPRALDETLTAAVWQASEKLLRPGPNT